MLLNLCFLVGIWLGGYILAPASWMPRSPNFNLVGILTYVAQAFHGGGWLALQYLQHLGQDDLDHPFNLIALGAKDYSDLGAFHLIVAGGLNYFSTVRLYDLLAGNPDLSASPSSSGTETTPGTREGTEGA